MPAVACAVAALSALCCYHLADDGREVAPRLSTAQDILTFFVLVGAIRENYFLIPNASISFLILIYSFW